jgi:hypothetical protein
MTNPRCPRDRCDVDHRFPWASSHGFPLAQQARALPRLEPARQAVRPPTRVARPDPLTGHPQLARSADCGRTSRLLAGVSPRTIHASAAFLTASYVVPMHGRDVDGYEDSTQGFRYRVNPALSSGRDSACAASRQPSPRARSAAIVESDPGTTTPRGRPRTDHPGSVFRSRLLAVARTHAAGCLCRPPANAQGADAESMATVHGRVAAWPPGALERELASAAPGGHDADRPQPLPVTAG